jgi:hypothetical protein
MGHSVGIGQTSEKLPPNLLRIESVVIKFHEYTRSSVSNLDLKG